MFREYVIRPLSEGLRILYDPKKAFEILGAKSLDEVVHNYILTIIVVGIGAAIAHFIFQISQAVYLDLSRVIDINYLHTLNYAAVRLSSIFFFYLFAGTILVIFFALVANYFKKKLKFVDLLKVIMYSITPLILFGWISANPAPFVIWAIFLFVMGMKHYNPLVVSRNSIHQRY